ncbi:type II toxin-antitoxin system VapC family toxin [Phormidium tenue]|jgi:PIN domain nuclease of toxin-antitoxin system|uniref:Type II toxin-antitoxin system VapC family toxin n=1 Tax=Phormidium tenue FACHB-1050 TaxID=2692857 RepID=A0ABR8CD54_9CYAN|nr:type II toxin-antitoxin system VapC family toxin [Phormidium tenue]MBD2318717.1 type II toxin-antitoxin system VapC family toxin [Phormidium tenue FACHB-1050]
MPEMIILDTHIWIWYVNENFDQIPTQWLEQIRQSEIVAVSAMSCYEVALAYNKGRLAIHIRVQDWLTDSLAPAGIDLLPLTPEITVRAVNLSPIHKDPFDRLIIATALEYGAKLASVDNLFSKYPELKNYLM